MPGSSSTAVDALGEGRAHVAGVHLRDGQTGDFNNLASLSNIDGEVTLVSYARWDQGFVVQRGNPLQIRSADDLLRSGLRFVNRDAGSGSRVLLEQALAAAHLPGREIQGYDVELTSHAAVVQHVAAGAADAGLAIEAVARAADLDFVPLALARFDLIIPNRHLRHPAVVLMLEALQRGALRRELQTLPGYDVSELGGMGNLN
jgi:putative molybdopterin biosynthesis protein